jgi:hypothetical protein
MGERGAFDEHFSLFDEPGDRQTPVRELTDADEAEWTAIESASPIERVACVTGRRHEFERLVEIQNRLNARRWKLEEAYRKRTGSRWLAPNSVLVLTRAAEDIVARLFSACKGNGERYVCRHCRHVVAIVAPALAVDQSDKEPSRFTARERRALSRRPIALTLNLEPLGNGDEELRRERRIDRIANIAPDIGLEIREGKAS